MPYTRPTFPRSIDYNLKRLLTDANGALNKLRARDGALQGHVNQLPQAYDLDYIAWALSSAGPNPLNIEGLAGVPISGPTSGGGSGPPTPPDPGLVCYLDLAEGQPAGVPASPNKRWMRGDFCGIDVPGMPSTVSVGGPLDANLITCFQYGFYSPSERATILADYVARGYTHFVMSWPDLRDRTGLSAAQAVVLAQEIVAAGMYPVWFLLSKDFDDPNNIAPSCDPIINAAQAAGVYGIACVGWELSLWMSPTQCQDAIDHVCAFGVESSGVNVYVHFQQGYPAFQQPGNPTSAFWVTNVGKLTGLLYQKDISWDCGMWQARTNDVQVRFAGGAGYPSDSGFGHPFDLVQYEYSASERFGGSMTEATARAQGNQGICSPCERPVSQGVGVAVSGYMNGGPVV